MTPKQRELLTEHGPYTVGREGTVLDGNGIALAQLHNGSGAICAWNHAFVAALNDAIASEDAEPPYFLKLVGSRDILSSLPEFEGPQWWHAPERRIASETPAFAHGYLAALRVSHVGSYLSDVVVVSSVPAVAERFIEVP